MKIIELTEENAKDYIAYIGEDRAEDLLRVFFDGLLVKNEEGVSCAGMVWEIINAESENDRQTRIGWLRIDDPIAAPAMFERYESIRKEEGITDTAVCIPAENTEKEKAALIEAGFDIREREGDTVGIPLSDLISHPLVKKVRGDDEVVMLRELSLEDYYSCFYRMNKQETKIICGDLMYLPRHYFEETLSGLLMKNDKPEGIILFHQKPSGALVLEALYVFSRDKKEKINNLVTLLIHAVLCGEENYSPDTPLIMDRRDPTLRFLMEKLFPKRTGDRVYVG